MYSVFYSVLPIFLITLVGTFTRRNWIKSDDFWSGLEKISFYLLFPMVLFEHSWKASLASPDLLRLVLALSLSTLAVAFLLVLYQIKTGYDKVQFTSIFQGATRYNSYILFGLTAALFNDEGLKIAATISPYMIILTNTLAVISLTHYAPKDTNFLNPQKGVLLLTKSVVTNPFVIASLLGFIFNYAQIELNIGISKTISILADSAFAIGMILVGSSLKFKVNSEHFRQIAFTSFIKLIMMPIITFVILWFMAINGMAKSVAILFSCLPCAGSSYILSRKLGGDPESMSSIITFTTIFSVVTLSVLMYILG